MKFLVPAPKENIYTVLRRLGYRFERQTEERQLVFSRIIGGPSGYPRFHLYITLQAGGDAVFHLHLDQKEPIYKGARAHGGEYEGETVEKEAGRIMQMTAQ